MSGEESEQSGAGRREVAYRLFAAEYEDADFSHSESDEERAPNYVITPTGARVNRLFVVGVLTEVEAVSEDVLRARVVDPTGAFVLYAGQYQPDEQAFLEGAEPPTFVAVTGKARTFRPDDSERVFTSVRPESINEVDAETRDRWTVQAAEQTLARVGHAAAALRTDLEGEPLQAALVDRGVDRGLAEGIALALSHYGTTPAYLAAVRDVALDAARVVAGTREEVRPLEVDPADAGDVAPGDLPDGTTLTGTALGTADAGGPEDAEATGANEASAGLEETTAAEDGTAETAAEPANSATDGAEESAAEATGGTTDIGDFDPEEFELEEETREEIEKEYGTEFQTGTEVEEPGNADIETPADGDAAGAEADEPADGDDESETEEVDQPADTADEPAGQTGDAADTADESAGQAETLAEPEDLQAAVVELMGELDDGTGADREALVATMGEQYGTPAADVEEAIQSALMDGQCYEPDDTSLKPI